MKRREPIELRKLKPETLSARLSHVHSGLKTMSTKLRNAITSRALDDDFTVGQGEEATKLRKELWALRHKLDSLLPWLGRIRNDCRSKEVLVRDQRKFKALGVDPEEVRRRAEEPEERSAV